MIGDNILRLFEENPYLLTNGYRFTKTDNKSIDKPINQFKNFYQQTQQVVMDRETIRQEILLREDGTVRDDTGRAKDPIQTGISTMQDVLFLVKDQGKYYLTHQFFDWIDSGINFYDYFIHQIINIRNVEEITGIHNGILCMLVEWLKYEKITDFSSITKEKFLERVKNEEERIAYCKKIFDMYGFAGDYRNGDDPQKGNYSPNISQRLITSVKAMGIVEKLPERNKDGFLQYTLSERGKEFLKKIDYNIGIIINGEDTMKCHCVPLSKKINDAPKAKKTVKNRNSSTENAGREEKESSSRDIKNKVKEQVGYICELEGNMPLFIEKSTGNNYVEGHHLIPMAYTKLFTYSLDVEANVVSVCPHCHRLLHYGVDNERKPLIDKLYNERKERLGKCRLDKTDSGEELTIEKLYSFYNLEVE